MLIDILAFMLGVWVISVLIIIKWDEKHPNQAALEEEKYHEEQSKKHKETYGIGL